MRTLSHFLMTAALERFFPRIPIHRQAFCWGAIAPDLPLWVLSLGSVVYYSLWQHWSLAETLNYIFTDLFFDSPLWIISHNLLHSPLVLLVGLAGVWRSRRQISSWQRWVFWFLTACLLHSIIDILTHVDDGPLLLFPLDWSLRFQSWISYWDGGYHGREFSLFEGCLNLVLLLYLILSRRDRSLLHLRGKR